MEGEGRRRDPERLGQRAGRGASRSGADESTKDVEPRLLRQGREGRNDPFFSIFLQISKYKGGHNAGAGTLRGERDRAA